MSTVFDSLIVPQPVQDLLNFQLSQKSAFVGSGAAGFESLTSLGGNFYMRFRADEDTGHGVVITGTAVSPSAIGTSPDIAPVLRRVRARKAVDGMNAALGLLSMSPTEAILRQTATWWAAEFDAVFASILAGLFDGSSGVLRTTHRRSVATASPTTPVPISYGQIVQAASLAGDTVFDLAAIVMHSKCWADLCLEAGAKISFETLGGTPIPRVNGMRVIVSDACPTSSTGANTIYTSYLLRPGALYIATQQGLTEFAAPDPLVPGYNLSQSWHFAAGAVGTKWVPSTTNLENDDLETPASWAKSATDKCIGVIALQTNSNI